MGMTGALKLRTIVEDAENVLAIELLAAAEGLEFRRPLKAGVGVERAFAACVPSRRAWMKIARSRPTSSAWPTRFAAGNSTAKTKNFMTAEKNHPRAARERAQLQRLASGSRLRMLMNNLDPDVAEAPDRLIVYGGTGRAARSWEAFDAIVRSLRELENDETLLVQSGKPVGIFRTHDEAPRVLIANSNLVGQWSNYPEFNRLEKLGLTMYGQMTAGSWIYIGSQGNRAGDVRNFLRPRPETFRRLARGQKLLVTGGLGGMGGAQPLAATMTGALFLGVDVDPTRIEKRLQSGYCDKIAWSLDEAMQLFDASTRPTRSAFGRPGRQLRGRASRKW